MVDSTSATMTPHRVKQLARVVFIEISKNTAPQAVFLMPFGIEEVTVLIYVEGSAQAARYQHNHPDRFVGVYNRDALLSDIEQDILYAVQTWEKSGRPYE